MKFAEMGDSFGVKLFIFEDVCVKNDIPYNEYLKAFLNILKGVVLDYYYNSLSNKTFVYNISYKKVILVFFIYFEDNNF